MHSLEAEAKELAHFHQRPVYIVVDRKNKEHVTAHLPGSLEWRQNGYTWVKTIKPNGEK